MSISSFHLRGISEEMMTRLKYEAKRLHMSVNSLILKMIGQELGVEGKRASLSSQLMYHDLDHLAGSWNTVDAKTFAEDTHYFEQIDKDLWS